MVSVSESLRTVRRLIEKAAHGVSTVLVRGESGTGKEVAARALHARSARHDMPFVKIQCASLPDALLESELFGYERGAFTGAWSRKTGRMELAQGGTLFLDEIGDITPAMQVKLLRLLQDRQFERLGGNETVQLDARIVAATHRDLETMIQRGEFRADLYYRLAVVTLWMPPLRTRRDDIEPLARHFCTTFAKANGYPEVTFTDDAVKLLRRQRWAGNVRELQNLVERLVVLAEGPTVGAAEIARELSGQPTFATQPTSPTTIIEEQPKTANGSLQLERRRAERRALKQALEDSGGNRTLAAKVLGISRRALYNMLDEHGVE